MATVKMDSLEKFATSFAEEACEIGEIGKATGCAVNFIYKEILATSILQKSYTFSFPFGKSRSNYCNFVFIERLFYVKLFSGKCQVKPLCTVLLI